MTQPTTSSGRCTAHAQTISNSLLALLAAVGTAAVGGCESGEKRVLEIAVKNNSTRPITVGPVKTGSIFEADWAGPSDVAIMAPSNADQQWGITILPGKTASTKMTGRFAADSQAYVLIFQGALSLSDILAVSKASPARRDWRITGPRTVLIVSDRGEFIDVFESPSEPIPLPPTATPSASPAATAAPQGK